MSERKAVERRRHPRVKKRYVVRFGPGDLAHTGYTQDISETGIYLLANAIYPPNTVLVLQIDYPEKTASTRGVVRWSKDLPPAFRRNLRGGMGVEFTVPGAERSSTRPAPAPAGAAPRATPSASPPPGASEADLGGGATRRRQVSTMGGNTYEILQTEYRGAIYVRVFQLPRTEGSGDALFNRAFWTREEADAAVKDFLREH